jgi:hypothetical protein
MKLPVRAVAAAHTTERTHRLTQQVQRTARVCTSCLDSGVGLHPRPRRTFPRSLQAPKITKPYESLVAPRERNPPIAAWHEPTSLRRCQQQITPSATTTRNHASNENEVVKTMHPNPQATLTVGKSLVWLV